MYSVKFKQKMHINFISFVMLKDLRLLRSFKNMKLFLGCFYNQHEFAIE